MLSWEVPLKKEMANNPVFLPGEFHGWRSLVGCSPKDLKELQVSEKRSKKKDYEKILEEIIAENFPKMGKEIITQVQETQESQTG